MGTVPSRVKTAFEAVKARARARLPWLHGVRLRVSCPQADREHRKQWRQFMHSGHLDRLRRARVCVAAAAEAELTHKELLGMIAHEFGHIIGTALGYPAHAKNPPTPKAVQAEADMIARRVLGLPIRYNRRTIEELAV